jgi:hypothetical protein
MVSRLLKLRLNYRWHLKKNEDHVYSQRRMKMKDDVVEPLKDFFYILYPLPVFLIEIYRLDKAGKIDYNT